MNFKTHMRPQGKGKYQSMDNIKIGIKVEF